MKIRQTEHGQLLIIQAEEKKLEDSFRRFHAENPHVYDKLVELSYEWRQKRPGQRCGIGMLFEVARWYLTLSTAGEPLKLNNNYRAFYARKLMDEDPFLEDLFELRKQRA